LPRTTDEKKYNGWIGASLYAIMNTFDDMVVDRRTYEEYGPDCIITRNLI